MITAAEVIDRLGIAQNEGGVFRVTARESTTLEFKAILDITTFKKCIKTIAAFANQQGGMIVFGVRDRPREIVGIGNQQLDEGLQSEQLVRNLVPYPTTSYLEFEHEGFRLAVLEVDPLRKPPCIAIRDLTAGANEDLMLKQGTIYARRRGQTAPITGEEFSQILLSRDETIREEIFGFLSRGRSIGFERAVVADTRGNAENPEGLTFYLPAEAAHELNVIDRARLVEDGGAEAYEIRGNVQLTVPAENDPRGPRRASDSANEMRADICAALGVDVPWNFSHLKKVSDHLGFWNDEAGDGVHTGREPLTNTTIYYEAGRQAVLNLARQNPSEFIDVSASAITQRLWRNRPNQGLPPA